ncbi:MAG: KH domain-containing protein [Spirochaetes bacterium]|nr:KH domain-containing protein [Spirochaetota bacterium]
MKVIEKYGKTEDEALSLALKEAGMAREDNYTYEVSQKEGRSGFLGLGGGKNLGVKLFVYEEEEQKIVDKIKEFFKVMDISIDDVRINKREDDRVFISLQTPDMGTLIGRRGKTLESIQFILSLIINKSLEKNIYIILDAGNYREKRVKTLENLAKNIASRVRKYKKPFILEPMNSYDRRIIHSTLQDEEDIQTQSIGDRVYKKVKIMLKR